VVAGVIGRFSLASSPPAQPRSLQAVPGGAPLAPHRQANGSLRFRIRAPGALQVAVVGEWNQWLPEPLAAAPEGEDLWQVDLNLPTGRYTYSFLIDGQSVKPPDAEAYVSDGFGGTNGVIEVSP
jgi:1,4-alpha-glucan branching enzyme